MYISTIPYVLSCTVFHASNENVAFGGNNEDWSDPDTHIYFIPPSDNEYGRVIVGFTGNYWIQGGMNEKGLFWDGLATSYLEVKNSTGKPYFNGHIFDYILSVCETCDEAIDILNQYNMKILERAQILMGDKYGDSFIIEGDIIHRKSDYYQLSTNFYLSQYPNPPSPCLRYNTALEMFQSNSIDDLSVDFCASVLDAVHQEGAYPTQYSNVYDLKNGLVYLYYNHNYGKVKIFNLSEEFELGYHSNSIPELFDQVSLPPYKPGKPIGEITGIINEIYHYKTSTIDPEGDDIYYLFNWDDGTYSDWFGPYNSGEEATVDYIWKTPGNYSIQVKAKDIFGVESEWSDPLDISMPKQKKSTINSANDWYYYPKFQNYAPNGMPDFDQKQNNWRDTVYNGWTFCGAVSVSNILWYLDSFYSNFSGIPGDGNDSFPIVLDYNALGESNPGPYSDDHNVNNVNDLSSSWNQEVSVFGNELVERVAWYVDTNGCRTGEEIWGTNLISMYNGVLKWLDDVELSQYFQVEMIFPSQSDSIISNYKPGLINFFNNTQGMLFNPKGLSEFKKLSVNQEDLTFHNIASKVTNGSFVVLGINGMDDDKNINFAHWVAIAGVSMSQYQIALSDPYFDVANRTNDYTLHNDASFVSHDIYTVNTTSPFPEDADYWWLEGYLPNLHSVVPAALIITPLIDNIPEVSPVSFFIKPDEGFLFINGNHIMTTLLGNTFIFGDITFEANAFSKNGIDRIEFYVNDEIKYVDNEFPFEWNWKDQSFGRYNITIKAIDNSGDIVENYMGIWRFF